MSVPLTFLVASPHLRGGIFEGAVILLLEHDAKGAMGLIVNSPMSQSVSELLPDMPGQLRPAWRGGPIDRTLGWCLYRTPLNLEGEVRLSADLLVTSSLDVLRAVMESGQDYMLILGYAGWDTGQLTEEARVGMWIWVEQETPDLIWTVPAEARWAEALAQLGVTPGTIMPGGAQA
ncbi:YqgE/AlgH family protein [Deinococcus oregonensis]|uniref:YqgE/AlgH family protein n=1 Tax=Deinococcus oregonensis TaxID=1805970 RepID=A0ABV6B755_9DEIO